MKIADALMRRTTALPAAGAAANSTSVDLHALEVGPVGANLEVHFTIPDVPDLADTKDLTVTFQDSADNSTFAAVAGTPTLTFTGAASAGASGNKVRFYLPPATRRYVRGSYAVEADGGDNTGVSGVLDFRV